MESEQLPRYVCGFGNVQKTFKSSGRLWLIKDALRRNDNVPVQEHTSSIFLRLLCNCFHFVN